MHASFLAAAAHPAAAAVSLQTVGLVLMRVASRVRAVRDRARTRRVLGRLDDAALKDIGLTRPQIDAVERDRRYGQRLPGFL